jgi:hypothetical protein
VRRAAKWDVRGRSPRLARPGAPVAAGGDEVTQRRA